MKKKLNFILDFINNLSAATWFVFAFIGIFIGGGIVNYIFYFNENPVLNYLFSTVAIVGVVISLYFIFAICYLIYEGIAYIVNDIRESYELTKEETEKRERIKKTVLETENALPSPLDGKVLKVCVYSGKNVKRGDLLFIIETCKMENEILSPGDGMISDVLVSEGNVVTRGDTLLLFHSEVI